MGRQYVDTNTKSFVTAAAVAQYTLMTKTANPGEVGIAGASSRPAGIATQAVFAVGDRISLMLISKAGTFPVIASGAIAAGAEVFLAANGKVAAAGTVSLGTALDAAAADGEIIEVLPA